MALVTFRQEINILGQRANWFHWEREKQIKLLPFDKQIKCRERCRRKDDEAKCVAAAALGHHDDGCRSDFERVREYAGEATELCKHCLCNGGVSRWERCGLKTTSSFTVLTFWNLCSSTLGTRLWWKIAHLISSGVPSFDTKTPAVETLLVCVYKDTFREVCKRLEYFQRRTEWNKKTKILQNKILTLLIIVIMAHGTLLSNCGCIVQIDIFWGETKTSFDPIIKWHFINKHEAAWLMSSVYKFISSSRWAPTPTDLKDMNYIARVV